MQKKLIVVLPRTYALDLARAFAVLGTTVLCVLQRFVQRKLERNDWVSFGRVWRAPHYLEVALRLGRGKFHHYFPYVRMVEAGQSEQPLVVLDLRTVLDRLVRDWGLEEDEGKVLEQVVLLARTNAQASAALGNEGKGWTEKMVEVRMRSIYRKLPLQIRVPSYANSKVWLTHQVWRAALEQLLSRLS